VNDLYEVTWTEIAEEDVAEIIDYIAADNLSAARKLLQALKEKAQSLVRSPQRGRVVPELREFGISWYRELIYKHWRTVYRIEGGRIYVVGVFDSRRNLRDILLDRLLRS
jgi:plasmid stabilization system protein ParE